MRATTFLLFFIVLFVGLIPQANAESDEFKGIQTVLVAKQQADISSPISGKIKQLPFFEGDIFTEGDVLAAYDCAVQNAQHDQAKARFEVAAGLLEAQLKLKELNTISKLELLKAQAEAKQAKAEVQEYKAYIDKCVISAPFDGRITRRSANPFETTEAGEPLLSIASLENLQAKILVPSKWLSWLGIDSKVEIEIQESGQRYGAHVVRIGGAVDPVSQSIQLIAELDESYKELLPGMSGVVHFETPVQ
jgi:RND family efflux transporter MFP subunit